VGTKVLVVVAAVVVAAAIGVGIWYVGTAPQRAYDKGHAAYLAGDCTAAMDPLTEAANNDTDEELASTAAGEVAECEALLAADSLVVQGRQADAVLAYSAFVTEHPASPIVDVAVTKGQTLITEGPTQRVGTVEVCDALDTLDAQRFVASRDEVLPGLLLACGEAYAEAGDFATALVTFDRVRNDYPDHPVRATVDEAYARAAVAEAEAAGAGELNPPDVVGGTAGAGAAAAVVIRNESNERLTIVFSGPEQLVEELAPCEECEAFPEPPQTCPDTGGPQGRYEVPAGTYDVVVRAADGSSVQPFRGTWTLDAGFEYADCFFVVEG
jgi:hypothetical protein